MLDADAATAADLDRRARDRQHAGVAGGAQPGEERALVDEDARLVAGDDVEVEQLGVEEARRPSRGHDRTGVDRLDVAHRPRQLALDLGVDEVAHRHLVHLVDHRVPDRAAVLQPVQIDRTVGGEGGEVGRAAVVLVDQPAGAVADDERRVAAGPVGDRRLDVDRHREVTVEAELVTVGGADQVVEAERPQPPVELAARVAGHEHGDVAAHVARVGQPRLVEVIAVEVGDVEVVGVADPVVQVVERRSLRGKTNHDPKNAGTNHGSQTIEPSAVSMRMPAWPSDVARIDQRGCRGGTTGPQTLFRRRAGRCTAGHPATRARSTPFRPSTAARSDPPDRRTTRPGPRAWSAWSSAAPTRSTTRTPRCRPSRRRPPLPPSCRCRRPSRCRPESVRRRRGRVGGRDRRFGADRRRRQQLGRRRRIARRFGGCRIGGVGGRPVGVNRSGGAVAGAAEVGDDVRAGVDDGDDVPPVSGLLGERGSKRSGLERGHADGLEVVHAGNRNRCPSGLRGLRHRLTSPDRRRSPHRRAGRRRARRR